MQYINGNEISRQNIREIHELAVSPKIPWTPELEESDTDYLISSHTIESIYITKGVCDFSISPEKLYEILYNIKLRHKWDYHCQHAEILEEYDHLNHIIHLKFTNPLIDCLEMNLYRSCRYDPQARVFVIAMRSIELEETNENQFECLPNGWVIQGLQGEKDKCRLTFIQQCQKRDIDSQRVPGYRSFDSKETLQDFKFLTLFPATVCGRLGTIFKSLEHFINNNKEVQEIQDSRISIMEKAEKEVNEMFGTTNPDYGWKIYLKKLDMEILIKKTEEGYYMIGKGSFSSIFPPSLLADVLYDPKNPFEWDTFYDKTELIEDINANVREVEVNYRMWRNTINMRLLQSVKKGPGNFSSVHWRSISSPGYQVTDGIEVHYLPTGLLNYGLGEGSFTSFLAAIEVKGYPTPWEQEMVTKLFAARIISNQNSIMNHVNKISAFSKLSKHLPVIPTIENHCGEVGPQIGSPQVYNEMVENFANILLNDNNKDNNIASSKNKRKRNGTRDEEENGADLTQQQLLQQYQHNEQAMRPSLRLPGVALKNGSMEQTPIAWNESKKQPFLFLVSDSGRKGKIQRKSYYFSNSSFDNLPEELIHIIFFNLSARDIINVSLVCKRFKVTTDNTNLWKHLFKNNPSFNKKIPKKEIFNPAFDNIIISNPSDQQMIENSTQIPMANDQPAGTAPVQQTPLEMAGININDPISLLVTLTNGNIPVDLSANDTETLRQLISQVNFTDFSNIDQVLAQLPPQIMSLIPMETIQSKIQEMKALMRIISGMPQTNQENHMPQKSSDHRGNSDESDGMNRKNKNKGYRPYDEFINWKAQYTQRFKQSDCWTKLKPTSKIELKGHTKSIKSVKTEGNSAVSIAAEKKVRMWNLNSGECISTYEESNISPISIEYDRTQRSNSIWPLSDYTKVYVGFKNGSVSIVDFFEQPIKAHTFNRMSLLADGFDFSYHGKFFIWEESIIELWDVESSTRLWQEPVSHSKKIIQTKLQLHSSISNDGIALTTSSDRTAKIWNLSNGQLISSLNGHTNAVNCIESIGDYMLLTGSSDKTLKLWDLRQTQTFLSSHATSHTSPIRCLTYQEKNGIVLSGSDDGYIIGWSLDNWDFSNIEPINLAPPTPVAPPPPAPANPAEPAQPAAVVNNVQPTVAVANTQQQILQNLPKISLGTFKESSKIPIKSPITCIDSDEAGFISGSSNGTIFRWDFNN
ncbi:hypothetical protein DICPUDRAFT_157913 [Dictyostelium purpureum]|uniref:F-box domain-containing protein n=1 Tax=Dictyostelium purpureum TaxID=5786 RepID=F1A0C0_DICPU|nr:uncharacterized protein DICPUDRAFT_157913 [Dictyostelium purpureum]EGC30372.1 hypothetical protein DICPUDRAFT_157913 [Dictyostelium purpureum]|eukprot:XP_003293114.1 hypothetical protein DICPUDRAFT_157913 [Dictyostelium purpureum]